MRHRKKKTHIVKGRHSRREKLIRRKGWSYASTNCEHWRKKKRSCQVLEVPVAWNARSALFCNYKCCLLKGRINYRSNQSSWRIVVERKERQWLLKSCTPKERSWLNWNQNLVNLRAGSKKTRWGLPHTTIGIHHLVGHRYRLRPNRWGTQWVPWL